MAGPIWKATGPQLQSGNLRFWWWAQLEGDRSTTAIWELELFARRLSWKMTEQSGNSRLFGGRSSWKATGLELQSGNLRFFFWVAGPVGTLFFLDRQSLGARTAPAYKNKNVRELLFICGLGHFNRDVGPDFSWRRALEHFLSVALLHVYSLYRNECGCFHVRRAAV